MQHELPYSSGPSRPGAAGGPPPAYTRIALMYPYSLRPVILFTTFISSIYLIVVAVSDFKSSGIKGTTGALKARDIAQGGLFMLAAVVEIFGFVAAFTQRLPLARAYSSASVVGYLGMLAAELLGIVTHYTMKGPVVDQCTERNTGSGSDWLFGDYERTSGTLTADEARRYCDSQYGKASWVLIVVFVFTLLLGATFVSFSFGYVHQLINPSSVRVGRGRTQVAPSAQYNYPQQPYDAPPRGPHAYPPTGPYAPPAGVPPNYDYADGRPSDDWETDYKTPGGAPGYDPYAPSPRGGGGAGAGYNNRPGSSRDADAYNEERRNSEETLKGDDVKTTKLPARDDDSAPRI